MFEQIKVLNGILALDQFTAAELVRYTEVKSGTVYTVLTRHADLLSKGPAVSTPRRGGQTLLYSLKPEAVDGLRAEIAQAAAAFARDRRQSDPEEISPSLNLEAAEEFLIDRMEKSQTAAEKQSLLDTADVYLTAAEAEFRQLYGDSDSPLVQERASRLKTLRGLRKAVEARMRPAEIPVVKTPKYDTSTYDMTPYPAAPAVPAWQGAGARPAPAFPNVAALFDKGRVVVVQATSAARHHWTDTLRIALSDDNGLQTVFVTLDPGEMRAMQGGVPKILDAVRKAGNFFKGMIFAVDSRQHASGVVIRQLDALATTSVLGGAPPLVLDASYNGALRRDVFCHNGTYEGDAAGLGAKQLWQVVKGPLVRSAFEVGDHAPAVLATAAGAMIDKTAG